jgi:hypothetical protein
MGAKFMCKNQETFFIVWLKFKCFEILNPVLLSLVEKKMRMISVLNDGK